MPHRSEIPSNSLSHSLSRFEVDPASRPGPPLAGAVSAEGWARRAWYVVAVVTLVQGSIVASEAPLAVDGPLGSTRPAPWIAGA
jgi:hypothetical protein